MIDQKVFAVEWGILESRYRREFSDPVRARYYQSLSPRMDTATFRRACRVLFDRPGHYSFPGPAEFLVCLDEPSDQAAIREWELCERVMHGERHVLGRMSDSGRHTVDLMGGPDRLGQTREDDVHFRRQEFLRLYDHAHQIQERERKELPPWTPEGRELLAEITGEDPNNQGTDPADRYPELPPYVDTDDVV